MRTIDGCGRSCETMMEKHVWWADHFVKCSASYGIVLAALIEIQNKSGLNTTKVVSFISQTEVVDIALWEVIRDPKSSLSYCIALNHMVWNNSPLCPFTLVSKMAYFLSFKEINLSFKEINGYVIFYSHPTNQNLVIRLVARKARKCEQLCSLTKCGLLLFWGQRRKYWGKLAFFATNILFVFPR